MLEYVTHIEREYVTHTGISNRKYNRICEPLQKYSTGGRDLRDRSKGRHLVQETPVAYSHGFRVPVTRQWDVVAAATTAKHFTTISAMVPTSHDRESCLASHASWRVVVRHPSGRSLDALLPPLGNGRSCRNKRKRTCQLQLCYCVANEKYMCRGVLYFLGGKSLMNFFKYESVYTRKKSNFTQKLNRNNLIYLH